jgi:hypothetical protein
MSDDRGRDDNNQIVGFIEQVLDRGFTRLLRPFLSAGTSPELERRVKDLQGEANRLAGEGKALTPDNPYLVSLTVTLGEEMARQNAVLQSLGGAVQQSAIESAEILYRRVSLGGLTDGQLAQLGVRFNVPNPEALNAVVDYTGRAEFARAMGISSDVVLKTVQNQILMGVAQGWSPNRLAETLAFTVKNLPLSQATTMMRTLQLSAYRQATFLYDQQNADIIQRRVRIGALDGRICMACLALHGTVLGPDETVNDHHNGRCISLAIIIPSISPRIITGEQYWGGLSETDKRALAGDGAYEAIRSGRAQLRDFVQDYDDDLFGAMVREKSLKDVLAGSST